MPKITTHVLDIAQGSPAEQVGVVLEVIDSNKAIILAESKTNRDGRVAPTLFEANTLMPAAYRVTYFVKEYFEQSGRPCFYPFITVNFMLTNPDENYHIPLLVSPFGYSTYRGS